MQTLRPSTLTVLGITDTVYSMTLTTRFDRNALVLFNTNDGTKVRLAIGRYNKAKWPELVDIKITDWCDLGCSFCYQDSTLAGKPAPLLNMIQVVSRLSAKKVFEVALGGGETTSHPDFVEILRMFKNDARIVPNFTTRKPASVRKLWPEIGNLIGGFAYSADNAAQVRSAAHLLRDIPQDKAALHYVMGLGDQQHFEDFLKAANEVGWRVTLLGYKTSGRGAQVTPQDYSWWMESVSKLVNAGTCPSLSIDTPLAAEYDGRMPVDKTMYHTREGAFSMYIDAVAMTMGASSFDPTQDLVPFDEKWVERYKSL